MENRICKFFSNGHCKKGDSCEFKHVKIDKPLNTNPNNKRNNKRRKGKNTETFEPSHKNADMYVRVLSSQMSPFKYYDRDVNVIPDLYCSPDDMTIYDNLLEEIKKTGAEDEGLWKLWHGDTHLIADDKIRWKQDCPTFNMVLKKMEEYFKIDIKATRLNWYRDSSEWKPYHHDAAAVDPRKAKTQNLTVGVSFGAEREIAFEHAKNRNLTSFPLPNGTTYTFGKDVNIEWRHGVPQLPPDQQHNNGRISIIAWGWREPEI